jgi:hypothetical protein
MSDGLRTCTTVDGRTIALPRTRFVVRPSVYARVMYPLHNSWGAW